MGSSAVGRWSRVVGEKGRAEGWSLGQVLGHLERQVCRRLEQTLASEGLTVDQWRVLDLLADGAGHPMLEIAAHIVVPGATLTKLADRLVDAALVYRLVDETDRRRVLGFLSEKGREVHDRLRPEIDRTEADILDPLRDEGELLIGLLTRLTEDIAPEPAHSSALRSQSTSNSSPEARAR
jgi:DNA-binding MarR family transcriptional regulator